MSAKSKNRRSAFAVYQQMEKEREQEKAPSTEKATERDASPETSQSSKAGKLRKRKVVAMKTVSKKRRLAIKEERNGDGSEPEAEDAGTSRSKWKGKAKTKKKVLKVSKKKKKRSRAMPDQEDGEEMQETVNGDICGSTMDYATHTASGDDVLDTPFYQQFNPEGHRDSQEAARELFQMVIHPLSIEKFHNEVWEKKPLFLRRHKKWYNDGWFSSEELDRILREHELEFSVNIDITSYEDGERQTHNPSGRAYASNVWEYFKEGCSARLLNPQTFSQPMWLLNSTLQEHFGCCVGANVYLTPANTQGFAPHYDDIEAFVLQIEGRKLWKLYHPRDISRVLPRYSSPNFSQEEVGELMMEVLLEPGDLLYFPRGTIHQASTLPDSHSLHITVSTFQKNSWADLLEKLVPAALETAVAEDAELRRGLPLDYLDYMGVVNSDINDPRRKVFFDKIQSLMSNLLQFAPVDSAVDQMAAQSIHNSLPPCLTPTEEQGGMWVRGAQWEDGRVTDGVELTAETQVRLTRRNALRLVVEDSGPIVYFSMANSRVYQERDLQGMDISAEDAPAIECLIHSYPEFTSIDSLMGGSIDDMIELCYGLYSQGLLLIQY